MSTTDRNKDEDNIVNDTQDKKQIEAEEREVMLSKEHEAIEEATEAKGEGPVKAALLGEVTDQGREVKPKFIPIGAIKMPGFFTKNSEKDKKDGDGDIEKDIENDNKTDENPVSKPGRFKFLYTYPFSKLKLQSNEGEKQNKNNFLNIKYPKVFQRKNKNSRNPEAALASMETLEEKHDSPDRMENIKLSIEEPKEAKPARLPIKERIRQKKFIIDDIVVCIIILLVLLAVIIGIVIGTNAGPPRERPLRLGRYMSSITSCGPVEGILDEGVYKFYGIPYATPPIGEKRFTYAQPLNNISMCWNGTLETYEKTPLCLQFLENGTIIGDEDCLTLDIVTPHVRYDYPLPVVVLIGANSLAGGISPAQPSGMYARTKEVVFVRPNFRLGPFGFLALDILNKKYPPISGNYGLSDLLVALKWIKLNINNFGGDPKSVTLLGHRAGATLTAALSTVHKAYKLYSRVWFSSPSVIFPGEPLDQAIKSNEQFKQLSKCNDIDCLRRIPATEILSSTPDTWLGSNIYTLPSAEDYKHSWLVLDGEYLRVHAYEAWDAQREANENGKKVLKPMVFGTTQHSAHSVVSQMKYSNWTADVVEKLVNDSVLGDKNLTTVIFKHFNKTYEGLVQLISSIRTLCPLVSLARMRLSSPMYVVMGSGAGGGLSGSSIAGINSDVEAILGTFDSEYPEQRRFMAAMQQLFYYYVWHGTLPGPETDLIAVGQDLLKLPGLPACDLLISQDIVPRYSHVD